MKFLVCRLHKAYPAAVRRAQGSRSRQIPRDVSPLRTRHIDALLIALSLARLPRLPKSPARGFAAFRLVSPRFVSFGWRAVCVSPGASCSLFVCFVCFIGRGSTKKKWKVCFTFNKIKYNAQITEKN